MNELRASSASNETDVFANGHAFAQARCDLGGHLGLIRFGHLRNLSSTSILHMAKGGKRKLQSALISQQSRLKKNADAKAAAQVNEQKDRTKGKATSARKAFMLVKLASVRGTDISETA